MIIKIFFIVIIVYNTFAQQKPLQTVDFVDLKKYSGIWYEIAKIPNKFQKHCLKDTKAEYKLKNDNEIEVINSCIDDDGKLDKTEGIARVVDKKTNAKLEVSFFSIFGWRPFWGDYWIIGLDKDYQWAIVGTPNRKYGWILARNRKIDKESLSKIHTILIEQGYDPSDFK